MILCHFHVVIVKSDFGFKPVTESVVIKFGDPHLGGWTFTDHKLSVEK